MKDKQRLAGFKALVENQKNSRHLFEEMDGSLRGWQKLSPQSKLQYIAGDAASHNVSFNHFAEAVQGALRPREIAEASLRMVLHYERELRGLEKMLPDSGQTVEMPLADRVKELLQPQPNQTRAEKRNERGIER
jgi:hypothetical protein